VVEAKPSVVCEAKFARKPEGAKVSRLVSTPRSSAITPDVGVSTGRVPCQAFGAMTNVLRAA
jgi:hypothetical protein